MKNSQWISWMLDCKVIAMERVKLKEDIVLEEKEGYISREAGAILLDYETSKYYEINETGTAIIRLIQKGKTVDGMVEDICNEYEVSQEEALNDINEFLEKLKKYTLLEE